MNETEKQLMVVTTQVDTFEKAKELLADLEVLNEKYEVNATITICRQVKLEAFYEQI
ncbi:hypothetical protein P3T75_11025 [Enterococcus montenegrensis]|uniref:hypothetical protein n=1 Tax=Enterococcus montenegrensis TaxID=3031993 RepID=UPI00249F8694|nr:hypothetical protein [Enterococcus montenegrensis]WHA08825.1 hypothetical protein P3T75_11025 [Enterococcus montenegrensis]